MAEVLCKTCDIGVLMLVRKYRMSGIVVAIGYILLVPSVLGVLGCALTLFEMPKMKGAGAGLAEGMMLMVGFFWFVGGLLGWLLVMKKSVLQCNNCTAVVAAS